MFGIGPLELVVVLVVALLVFGPKRVPELARTVGRGLAEFRRASRDLRQTLALDELEQDIRRDLTGDQTIQRPKEDRPAQAGDDPAKAANTTETTETTAAGASSDREEDSKPSADSALGNVPATGSNPTEPRRG